MACATDGAMRLRTLTAMFLTGFGLVTTMTGYAQFQASRSAIAALVDRRIATVADALLDDVPPGDAGAILSRIAAFARQRQSGDIGFELEDGHGRRLGGNIRLSRPLHVGFSTITRNDRIAGLSAGRAEVRDAGGGLVLVTVAETEPIDGYAAIRLRNYLLGFGLIVAVVLGGTVAFGVLVGRRVDELSETALAISSGDLTRRLPVDPGGGVFADQAATFNAMLDRIATLVDGLRHVGSDIAHDLRTPLARLRSRLATIADRNPDADVDAAMAQCDALLAVFTAILRIAEIDTGDRRRDFRTVDLTALVEEIAETLADAAGETGHGLRVGRLDAVSILGDRQLLAQAVLNLAENALRHTPPGTAVTLSVARGGDGVRVAVTDAGPGIAPADRARARRRFGRLDASRNRPGHGLGLPIVEAIAHLHDGTLVLEDARPGLAAALSLPIRS